MNNSDRQRVTLPDQKIMKNQDRETTGEIFDMFVNAEEETLEEFFQNKTGMGVDEFLEWVFPDED